MIPPRPDAQFSLFPAPLRLILPTLLVRATTCEVTLWSPCCPLDATAPRVGLHSCRSPISGGHSMTTSRQPLHQSVRVLNETKAAISRMLAPLSRCHFPRQAASLSDGYHGLRRRKRGIVISDFVGFGKEPCTQTGSWWPGHPGWELLNKEVLATRRIQNYGCAFPFKTPHSNGIGRFPLSLSPF